MTTIPQIPDKWAPYWDQLTRDAILVDKTHALMSRDTFAALPEYSASVPTGVYAGKMWRCCYWKTNEFGYRIPDWCLRWYGDVIRDSCTIHTREIILV